MAEPSDEIERQPQTSGEKIEVPVEMLLALAAEYQGPLDPKVGECTIGSGWGDSPAIEALLTLVPKAQSIRNRLPPEVWEATVWVGTNYVHGTIDGACRTRIVDAVLAVARPADIDSSGVEQ